MKIRVSACLVGDNCKYNGGNNLNERLVEFLAAHEVVKVCPEVLGGLATPRAPAEIQKGQVVAWVMSFGGGARVLSPQELKNRVGDAAREILKNN